MRIVYFGTPATAVPPLEALVAAGHDVAMVVTQPDRKRGRGGSLVPSPVRRAAERLGLRTLTPLRASEVLDDVVALDAELGVVVAFGQLLPASLLAAAERGFVNVHFSLLPRWRGAAPVERAILAGDAETGVAIMGMEAGLDTGPVFSQRRLRIGEQTAGELTNELVDLGTTLLVATLADFDAMVGEPQVGEPTYAAKLTVDEFRLRADRPAAELAAIVRAGNPRPGAWCTIDGVRHKVGRAALRVPPATDGPEPGVIDEHAVLGTVQGSLQLLEIQPEGKPMMEATAWRNGRRGRVQLDSVEEAT